MIINLNRKKSYNTAYTAHSIRPNFSYAEASYMPGTLDETRYALFAINLLEDLIKDIIFYYYVSELKPIKKIFESIDDIEKTCKLIISAK